MQVRSARDLSYQALEPLPFFSLGDDTCHGLVGTSAYSFGVSADGNVCAFLYYDLLVVYKSKTASPIFTAPCLGSGCFALSPDGCRLVFVEKRSRQTFFVDLMTGELTKLFDFAVDIINLSNALLAYYDYSKSAILYDLEVKRVQAMCPVEERLNAIALSSDSALLATGAEK